MKTFGTDAKLESSSAQILLNELFVEWLLLDSNPKVSEYLHDDVSFSVESPERMMAVIDALLDKPHHVGPPRSPTKSPKKRTQSDMLSSSQPGNHGAPLFRGMSSGELLVNDLDSDAQQQEKGRRRASIDAIPTFYIPGKNSSLPSLSKFHFRIKEDSLANRQAEIEALFKPFPGGVAAENFVHITKNLCGFPSFFNKALFQRIMEYFDDGGTKISLPRKSPLTVPPGSKMKMKTFLAFWQLEIEPYDHFGRFFRLVKNPNSEFIRKDDFVPFILELLLLHPGLDFLAQHEEFKRKYALTVIARIFYKVNISRTGKITCREIRRSDLVTEFMHVDEETDINRCVEYFSYEHFYVLYCRFFELDTDKDAKISMDDLIKYGDYCLSEPIIERIFQVGHRAFTDKREGRSAALTTMSYSDFIYFMLSEEDKSSECSLRYWFSCCDLDCDGKLSTDEMRYFYRTQLHRITNLGQEVVKFQDVLCQMVDMINPKEKGYLTLEDLCKEEKRGQSGLIFDALFNLHKFLRFETRDPFQEKLRREDPFNCDWDRFAHMEYHRLAAEEEGYDNSMEVEEDEYYRGNK